MKRIAVSQCLLCCILAANSQEPLIKSKDSFYLLTPVEIRSIRAGENAPFTKTNISKKQIERVNIGQDLPFLLNQTPSVVVNSDAGNGIGYTGIRIRGTDATRINVTLNGIPYNDAESQGTFFVDLPDLASSTGSIQIQRGVGTSSNGAGAFGASINLSTNETNKKAYAEFNNNYGSFNSWKNTIKLGTGLIGDHFLADLRLSRINSDGYIDRAESRLSSFYFSTAYLANRSSIRLNIFAGKEKTYQAWNGVSESDLKNGDRTLNYAGMEKPGEPYDNETDNYVQDHFQLFFDHRFNEKLSFNTAVFLVKGKGFYEQYKADESYSDYLQPDPAPGVTTTDLVRQLWLKNNFYGNIFSLVLKNKKSSYTVGGGWTRYEGRHFGELIWAENGLASPRVRWYDNDAMKTDFNSFIKYQSNLSNNWHLFADIQYRRVNYNINGFRYNPGLNIKAAYDFINPKLGITYNKNGWKGYVSYSKAAKEPNRDDFEAGQMQQPRREKLDDWEFGIERTNKSWNWSATFFLMDYTDQLVLTGRINDVGAYTRTNIANSRRMGIELETTAKFNSWCNISANLSLSRNRVFGFVEYLDDYDLGGQKINNYDESDLAFSPSVVAGATITFIPIEKLELNLASKYVSKQYLDNTGNEARKLNPFFTEDLRINYGIKIKGLKELQLMAAINNLFDKKYEPNGYSFSYIYGGQVVSENFYFPMAGRNFVFGINVKL